MWSAEVARPTTVTGSPATTRPSGIRNPATALRPTNARVGMWAASGRRDTSSRTSNVRATGPASAKLTMLETGTDASIGSFVGAAGFQIHQRSCGPTWSKTS